MDDKILKDFLNLSYDKAKFKIRTIRELINRISSSGLQQILNLLNRLIAKVDRLDEVVQELERQWGDIERNWEPPVIILNKPDLVVSSIQTTTLTNYVNFDITVLNQGYDVAGASKLEVVIHDHSTVVLDVPELGVLGEAVLVHQYAFDTTSGATQKTITATADSTKVVQEQNEFNNTKSVTFSAKQPYNTTGLIIHMHNPEGNEIGSVLGSRDGFSVYATKVGEGSISLTDGVAIDEATHAIQIPWVGVVGNWTIHAYFNGIYLTQNVAIVANITEEIFFVFPRDEILLEYSFSGNLNYSKDHTFIGSPVPGYYYTESDYGIFEAVGSVLVQLNVFSPTGFNFNHLHKGTYLISNTGFNYDVKYSYAFDFPIYIQNLHILTRLTNPSWTTLTNPIPISTSFNNWYCQKISSGSYPAIYIKNSVDFSGISLIALTEGYGIQTIPTNKIFNEAIADANYDMNVENSGAGIYSSNTEEKTGGGVIDTKMSSVPYDMLETAV